MAALLLLSASRPAAAAGARALSDAGRAELSRFLKAAVDSGDVPAVVALVADRERVLYHEAYGWRSAADKAPLEPGSVFRIFSMTKPITSLAVMQLVEEGRLALDDPVSKHLPSFASALVAIDVDAKAGTWRTRSPRRPLTIRHLLSNTSGIGYSFSNATVALLAKATGKPETELPLVHDPGERWTYGASTKVLGDIIAKVSGQPLESFFRTRVFEPLGMAETGFAIEGDRLRRLVTMHQRREGSLLEQPNDSAPKPTVRGDYGLYSTAADYVRFLQLLLGGGRRGTVRLLAPATLRLMVTNQIGALKVEEQPALMPELSLAFPRDAGRDSFGLGFLIAAGAKGRRSTGSYSWAGVMNTHFWVDPVRGIAGVVLMQILPFCDPQAMRVLEGMEEIVYRHLE